MMPSYKGAATRREKMPAYKSGVKPPHSKKDGDVKSPLHREGTTCRAPTGAKDAAPKCPDGKREKKAAGCRRYGRRARCIVPLHKTNRRQGRGAKSFGRIRATISRGRGT